MKTLVLAIVLISLGFSLGLLLLPSASPNVEQGNPSFVVVSYGSESGGWWVESVTGKYRFCYIGTNGTAAFFSCDAWVKK